MNTKQTIKPTTLFQENGHQYTGLLKNGYKNDPCGELFFDQFVYRGPFVEDMKHGDGANVTGIEEHTKEFIYDGPYREDKKHGQGQLVIKLGQRQEKYCGFFENDLYHGSGVHVNQLGDIYEGDFERGKRSGIGKLKQTRKEFTLKYAGEFANGEFDGQGQLELISHTSAESSLPVLNR